MAEIGEGEKLQVLGPLGKSFDVPQRDQIPLLVAGGIGVAPLFFLAQSMKSMNIKFMAGFGSSGEIIRSEPIGVPRMDVSIATDDGTEGYAGPVTAFLEAYLRRYGPGEDSLSVFTCGPRPMLERVAALTMQREIDCQVSLEVSMACGLGACQGCAVRASSYEDRSYFHVCRDGPVFPVQSIDWGKP
jgi:dihydroorotate dehydrogenase electron transfer subunit